MNLIAETSYDFPNYKVVVGTLPLRAPDVGTSEPRYIVVNKETSVTEFDHEVLPFVLEWIHHFSKRLDKIKSGEPLVEEDEVAQIAGRFN